MLFRVRVNDQLRIAVGIEDPAPAYRFTLHGEDEVPVGWLKFGAADHEHGSIATLEARISGHDGGPLHFVVERADGDEWKPYAMVPAQLSGDSARGSVKVEHPKGAPLQPVQLRAHLSKGEA